MYIDTIKVGHIQAHYQTDYVQDLSFTAYQLLAYPGSMLIPLTTRTCCIRNVDVLLWDGWAHKPGLTHLSLVCSLVLCVHYQ